MDSDPNIGLLEGKGLRVPFVQIVVVMTGLCVWCPAEARAQSDAPVTDPSEVSLLFGVGRSNVVPVNVEAQVSHWEPDWAIVFVQAGDVSMFVRVTDECFRTLPPVDQGDVIQIRGSIPLTSNHIDADEIKVLRPGTLPPPIPVTIPDLELGDFQSVRVVTRGRVRSINVGQRRTYLLMENGGHQFTARVLETSTEASAGSILNAEVEVVGTLALEADPSTDSPSRYCVQTMGMADVRVVSKPDRALPDFQDISSVAEVYEDASASGSVRMMAQVGHVSDHKLLVLERQHRFLRIPTPATELINTGDMIKILGQVTRDEDEVTLTPLYTEVVGIESLPTPIRYTAKEIVEQHLFHSRLTVSGHLKSVQSFHNVRQLSMESDGIEYHIVFVMDEDEFQLLPLRTADVIRAQGWVRPLDEAQPPLMFEIELDETENLVIIEAGKQLDRGMVYLVGGILLACVLAGATMVFFLRWQVSVGNRKILQMSSYVNATYETILEGVLFLDHSGKPVQQNRRFHELLNIDLAVPSSEPVEVRLASNFADPGEFLEFWESTSLSDTPASVNLKTPEPNAKHLKVATAAVADTKKRAVGRLWTFGDVTERQQLENQLRHSQKMDAVGHLAGGIAHDFNNLLNVVSGCLELTEFGPIDPSKKNDSNQHLIEVAQNAVANATTLVKRLLGFSRKASLELREGNLNDVVLNIQSIMHSTLSPKMEIDVQLESDLWQAEFDHLQLEQVLLNLCLNADAALPSQGGKIAIRTKNSIEGGFRFVNAVVEDNGEGMSEGVRARIFEPFFTTKEPGEGTGLGLAMCEGIVAQHKGLIRCTSTPGEGSRFEFRIPAIGRALTPEVDTSDHQASDHQASGHQAFGLHSLDNEVPSSEPSENQSTILFVEDDESMQFVGRMVLTKLGFQVIVTSGALEALKVAENGQHIDVVLLDLTMPGMSGYEAFGEFTKRHPELPVIICSGSAVDLESFKRDYGRHPASFIQKPYSRSTINDCVTRVLAR